MSHGMPLETLNDPKFTARKIMGILVSEMQGTKFCQHERRMDSPLKPSGLLS